MLAALECVDAVVIFNTPTPLSLILALHPDVLVKGADYNVKNIAGASDVLGWGGKVILVPLVATQSTTNILGKLT
jgi:D-beta-D-heptose 7-phosphate kinase/D-beta-D-heptose 1-phosphate adenosyltransferase